MCQVCCSFPFHLGGNRFLQSNGTRSREELDCTSSPLSLSVTSSPSPPAQHITPAPQPSYFDSTFLCLGVDNRVANADEVLDGKKWVAPREQRDTEKRVSALQRLKNQRLNREIGITTMHDIDSQSEEEEDLEDEYMADTLATQSSAQRLYLPQAYTATSGRKRSRGGSAEGGLVQVNGNGVVHTSTREGQQRSRGSGVMKKKRKVGERARVGQRSTLGLSKYKWLPEWHGKGLPSSLLPTEPARLLSTTPTLLASNTDDNEIRGVNIGMMTWEYAERCVRQVVENTLNRSGADCAKKVLAICFLDESEVEEEEEISAEVTLSTVSNFIQMLVEVEQSQAKSDSFNEELEVVQGLRRQCTYVRWCCGVTAAAQVMGSAGQSHVYVHQLRDVMAHLSRTTLLAVERFPGKAEDDGSLLERNQDLSRLSVVLRCCWGLLYQCSTVIEESGGERVDIWGMFNDSVKGTFDLETFSILLLFPSAVYILFHFVYFIEINTFICRCRRVHGSARAARVFLENVDDGSVCTYQFTPRRCSSRCYSRCQLVIGTRPAIRLRAL